MDAGAAREKLVGQHGQLRVHFDRCTSLAHRLRGGERVDRELELALVQLRKDFAEHNTTEAALMRQLLGDVPTGPRLLDRMLEEHVGEHAAFTEMLVGTVADLAERIDDIVEQLDAHMAAEERTFLSPVILRKEAMRRLEPVE